MGFEGTMTKVTALAAFVSLAIGGPFSVLSCVYWRRDCHGALPWLQLLREVVHDEDEEALSSSVTGAASAWFGSCCTAAAS